MKLFKNLKSLGEMGDYTDYILEKGPLTCGNAEKMKGVGGDYKGDYKGDYIRGRVTTHR